MSEHVQQTSKPVNWLFPVIFLAIIAICALYIVRNNYNERLPSSDYSTKDTRSDHVETMVQAVATDTSNISNTSKGDSLGTQRERASMPEADSTRK